MNSTLDAQSGTSTIIEPATLRDLGTLRYIERVCFPKDAWPLLDLISVLSSSGVIRYRAVRDQKMVGFIAGDVRRSEGVSWIATIAVLPEYQGQGIGSALLRLAKSVFRLTGSGCACGRLMMWQSGCMSVLAMLMLVSGQSTIRMVNLPW